MKTDGMELLNQAIDADFALETVFSKSDNELPGKMKGLQFKCKEAFRIAIQALLQDQKNLDHFAAAVMLFNDPKIKCELFDKNSNAGVKLGIDMEKAEKIHAEYIFKKAEHLYKRATSADKNYPYRYRNDWLMKAIRLLMDSVENEYDIPDNDKLKIEWKTPFTKTENMQYKICILLSKCYFKRGLSILPKGKGVSPPEKKVEAMRKALKWADAAVQEDNSSSEPLSFKIKILYELYKISGQEYHEKLKTIADSVLQIVSEKSFVPQKISDLHVLSICCRFSNKKYDALKEYDLLILNAAIKNNDPSFSLCLMKAQAGLRINKNISDKCVIEKIICNTEETIEELEQIELFSTIWDEVIDLIRNLKDEKIDEWQTFAVRAWEICDDKESQMSCGLEIRQYWSRLERLYHLAIEGADNSIQKVCIIDSLKGRSLLAWNDLDVFLQQKSGRRADEIKKLRKLFYEGEANALMGNYIGQYPEVKNQLENLQKRFSLRVDLIPAGWTALHFYLQKSENEKLECRCIAGCNSGNTEQKIEWEELDPCDLTEVWTGYKKWRDKYYGLDNKTQSDEYLDELCEIIGRSLPFLFNEKKVKTNGIIFIPHGFMHLLPLHAAKAPASANWNDGEYLFERKVSTYLPAWSLIHKDLFTTCATSDDKYCCRNVEKSSKKLFYKNLIEHKSWTKKVDDADKDIFAKFGVEFKKPPDCLTILCHGVADKVFPVNSTLRLGAGGLSLIELQMTDLKLAGTKVLLGACESELAPAKTTQIDEHLSLAGTFLSKGASLVFGSMWECNVPVAEELILEALKKGISVNQMLQEKQKEWITSKKAPELWLQGAEIFQGYPNSLKLYFIAPFKITGYPLPIDS